jgi:hypothetical protein
MSTGMQETQVEEQQKTFLSKEERDERKKKFFDRINLAYEEAVNHIVEGSSSKILEAESNGKDQAILYSFRWVENPDDEHDQLGNKTVFTGKVRLLDMLTKGKRQFMKLLNDYFNKDQPEQKYHCGVFKKRDFETNKDTWYIFVSWSKREPFVPVSERKPRSNGPVSGRGGGRGGFRQQGRGGRGRGSFQQRNNNL